MLMFAATNVKAQSDAATVGMTVDLKNVLDLNVTAGSSVVFTFDTPTEYTAGMSQPDGSNTTVTMDATTDWKLSIEAADLTDGGTPPNTMQSENVGLTVEAQGNNTFTGNQVSSSYEEGVGSALGLPNAKTLLIDKGTNGNTGDGDNTFVLHWRCGTQEGTMASYSMMDLIMGNASDPQVPLGTYTTTVNLTLEVSN